MLSYLPQLAIPPALIFIAGALLVPFVKGRLKAGLMLSLPLLALLTLATLPSGKHWVMSVFDYTLVFGRVDRLSLVFGYVFCIVSFIGIVFALGVRDDLQHASALTYVGGALGVTFAGDFLSLYVFWELMAVASTFLVLASRTKDSQAAAFRYVLVHLFGGVLLLAGIVLYAQQTGTLEFDYIGLGSPASWFLLVGILVNVAAPPLHPWIKDAYPEATVTGAVFLCAFTTKSAVYVLTRTFPGTEILIYLGALMTAFPIFYAVLENNIRRVLAYSLINQVGFMVVGVGMGTPLAINGTVSHAFCHIIYKALLFMSTGSVLHMTGRIQCTDLGGIYKTMPLTCLFCMIAAASISAFPLFSGFVSKSMIVSSAGHEKLGLIWLVLQFASAGVIHHHGVKVPYFTFFSEDSGIRAKEPPLNMMLAMGLAAFLCVFLGVYPKPLYALMPYPVDYVPYTAAHVVGMLQLLLFGVLAFVLLVLSGYYPPEMRAINLDLDWFYIKGARLFYGLADRSLNGLIRTAERAVVHGLAGSLARQSQGGIWRLLLLPLRALWALSGVRGEELEARRSAAYLDLSRGSLPVGIGAALAALFIVMVFIFS